MRTALLLAILLAGAEAQEQQGSAVAGQPVDFIRDIQPIFRDSCLSCHGEKKQKGQLRLDSKVSALQGGVGGRIIVPGKGKESKLVAILLEANADDRMPQKADPLSKEKIDLVRTWIDQGATWPDSASVGGAADKHWAWVKPVRAEPPAVANPSWVRNPVDAFIAAELDRRGLKPRPEAPRHQLLRRVYLDLIGLPPTREELQAFLADPAPDAYEKVVDRLLADPRHGERWGRHWMDVWRYADWAGYQNEIRDSMKHIWRWRDWIVESLNADKPYDRMIVEMLAGDELAPGDPDTLRATGFLARNWQKFSRDSWLINVVEHTSKAFLATTMNCARCHGHFFDPISHQEYYQFRAFFEPYNVRTDHLPGQGNVDIDGLARVYDADPAAPTYLYVRGNEKNPDKSAALPPAVPRVLGGTPLSIQPVPLPKEAFLPEKRDFVLRDLLAADAKDLEAARGKIDASLQALSKLEATLAAEENPKNRKARDAALEELPLVLMAVPIGEARHASLEATVKAEGIEDGGDKTSDAFKKAATEAQAAQRTLAVLESKRTLFTAQRAVSKAAADGKKPEEIAAAKKKIDEAQKALAKAETDAKAPATAEFARRKVPAYPGTSTGRRLALARWIADAENPLTARVAANHLWNRHFGKPIVPTVFEFGKHGRGPSHLALLDWLATELVREHWSMKKMHRLLVTSAAYRMDSSADPAGLAADPENRLLWRMNARRMEAEVVRDSVLYLAGQLDLTRGGPDIPNGQGLEVPRRSLYFQHAAEKQVGFLMLFDGANVTECYERSESVVPHQALAMANSALVLEKARVLAAKLSKESAESGPFVGAAYEHVLGRAPSAAERTECEQFLAEQAALLTDPKKLKAFEGGGAGKVPPATDPGQRAREDLVQVLFNHNEFVTIR